MRRIKLNKNGTLAEDPTGMQVAMSWRGCTLLGDVRGHYRVPYPPCWARLKVTHFNGESWPFDPLAGGVEVLERTYSGDE
jgi:hypothetical protein